MFEATLAQGALLKKLIDSIKDLVTEANWECNETGIALQSMDSSHVALVALLLRADGFEPYRCDRNMTLGIKVDSMAKILKCASLDDKITLSAQDDGQAINFQFEGKNERFSEYELKLMDIDADQLGIPDTEYTATVSLASSEFLRICRDLQQFGENINITMMKDMVKFSVSGEMGTGAVTLRQTASVDDEDNSTLIAMDSPLSLDFSIKYMLNFAKASSLSPRVSLHFATEVPMLVEYKIEDLGYLRYYLASKISDDEDMEDVAVKAEEDY